METRKLYAEWFNAHSRSLPTEPTLYMCLEKSLRVLQKEADIRNGWTAILPDLVKNSEVYAKLVGEIEDIEVLSEEDKQELLDIASKLAERAVEHVVQQFIPRIAEQKRELYSSRESDENGGLCVPPGSRAI